MISLEESLGIRSRQKRPTLIIAGAFEDQRPFQGMLAHADWFTHGRLHSLAKRSELTGVLGERRLFLEMAALGHAALLVIGLGATSSFDESSLDAFFTSAKEVVAGLESPEVVFELPLSVKDVPKALQNKLFDGAPGWHFMARTTSGRLVELPRAPSSLRPREEINLG